MYLTGQTVLLLSAFQCCSVIAQLVEQATVNRPVVGSSPTHGAILLFNVRQEKAPANKEGALLYSDVNVAYAAAAAISAGLKRS